jgi:aspartate aminotransferase
MELAERVLGISESATLAVSSKAKKMKAEGVDVIDFGLGEPDFPTPRPISEAGIAAIKAGKTKYTPAAGTPALKKVIAQKLRADNGLDYEAEQIIVSNGAKHSIFNIVLALVKEGDEVVIPAPYWVSYPEMVKVAGGKPVYVESSLEEAFKLSADKLEAALTPKTKLLIINSPCNPTGSVLDEADLRSIADLLLQRDIYIISDEIYEKLVYEGATHTSIATVEPKLKERTIVINGCSKAYSMTGWRIGYAAGAKEIISAAVRLQSHSTSGPNTMAQEAALAALTGDQSCVEEMRSEFDRRRRFIARELNQMAGVECIMPAGAFYAFPRVRGTYGRTIDGANITDSLSLSSAVLEKKAVAIVPGVAFGADDYIRFSYATSMAKIEEGMKRLKEFLG